MTVISPEVLKRIRAVMAIYPDDPFACESEDIRALLAAYDTTRAALEGLVAAVPIACESADDGLGAMCDHARDVLANEVRR